ncbi:MAG: hypothetical protein ACFE9L_21190 [Candidatus Hodarchaeota archaeon]
MDLIVLIRFNGRMNMKFPQINFEIMCQRIKDVRFIENTDTPDIVHGESGNCPEFLSVL